MKKLLLCLLLFIPVSLHGQKTNVIHLTEPEYTEVKQLHEDQARITKRLAEIQEEITRKYLYVDLVEVKVLHGKTEQHWQYKPGYENGLFEYSTDFKSIVPNKWTGYIINNTSSFSSNGFYLSGCGCISTTPNITTIYNGTVGN